MTLLMGLIREADLETRPATRRRLDGDLPADRTDPLLDDDGTLARGVELGLRHPPGEVESASVVVHDEAAGAVLEREAKDDVRRPAVTPDVDEGLLRDPRELRADARRQRDLSELRNEARRDPGLAAELVHGFRQELRELTRVEIERPHLPHQLAQVQHFLPEHLLDSPELLRHRRRGCRAPAQCTALDS